MNSRSASIVGDQEAAGSSSFAWCNRQWLSSQALTRRSSVRPKQAGFNHNLLWLPESNGYPLSLKRSQVPCPRFWRAGLLVLPCPCSPPRYPKVSKALKIILNIRTHLLYFRFGYFVTLLPSRRH